MTDKSKSRQARYAAKKKAAGMAQVSGWVPEALKPSMVQIMDTARETGKLAYDKGGVERLQAQVAALTQQLEESENKARQAQSEASGWRDKANRLQGALTTLKNDLATIKVDGEEWEKSAKGWEGVAKANEAEIDRLNTRGLLARLLNR